MVQAFAFKASYRSVLSLLLLHFFTQQLLSLLHLFLQSFLYSYALCPCRLSCHLLSARARLP